MELVVVVVVVVVVGIFFTTAHPASYPMGTGSSFPGGKAVGA
jgi:hypothetical protein